MTTELIAQAVDMLAIIAAERKIKGDPPRVKRPDFLTGGTSGRPRGRMDRRSREQARQAGFTHAVNVLKGSARRTYVSA